MANGIVFILAAYLWGALSPAHIAARAQGIDLRRAGSGNVGSSNVGVQLGRGWTLAIGTLDWLKGLLPPLVARIAGLDPALVVGVGLATVIGHNWSLYLRFAGGRGMAATVGVLFAWDARLAGILLLVLAMGWARKQTALASMIGLLGLAPSAWLLGDAAELIAACGLLAMIVALKRLEANRLALPRDAREKCVVLWRRFWMDRDVPPNVVWEKRRRID